MKKSVLITGASRGIGAATALAFAAAGWQVAINYRSDHASAQSVADKITAINGTALLVCGDIAQSHEASDVVRRAEEAFGGLDAVVCNAGVGSFGLLSDTTDAQWRNLMGVNLDGVFFTLRSAIPQMVRRQQGAIVTVSSIWGVTGGSCEVSYSAAKAGVIGLTKALAKELGPSHIRVNCVAPGVIDTEMNAHLSDEDLTALAEETPLGRIGTADEVAQSILFLCDEKSSFFTGQVLQPNGGILI